MAHHEEFTYQQLFNEADKKLPANSGYKWRIAILADFETQFLAHVLKGYANKVNCELSLYTAGQDSVEAEVLNPNSALYAFQPDATIILTSGQRMCERLYASTDREKFASQEVARLEKIWSVFREQKKGILIQSNIATTIERHFGNSEMLNEQSVGSVLSDFNMQLVEKLKNDKSVLLLDIDYLSNVLGKRDWFDQKLWCMARCFCAMKFLPHVAKNIFDIIRASIGQVTKCIVLDLDNVLWGGAIAEVGVEKIRLGTYDEGAAFVAFQHYLLELKKRGIILTVVSKNDEMMAKLPFLLHSGMVLKLDDFAMFIANWKDKVQNIKQIQQTLNIGFEDMVFIDDSAFERNMVQDMLPNVRVPNLSSDPTQYSEILSWQNLFETTIVSQTNRTEQYRDEVKRMESKASYASVDEYLASLNMKAEVSELGMSSLARVAELSARSHQFNLTSHHYDWSSYRAFLDDETHKIFAFSLSDKFGNYGVVGVVHFNMEADVLNIEELFISCRVMQRSVESFVMNFIQSYAQTCKASKILGKFIVSDKNETAATFYEKFGFKRSDVVSGVEHWEIMSSELLQSKTYIV